MNCPCCSSASPEGKKFCADCGAALDPQTTYLQGLIDTRIGEAIAARFKDQKLVDIETSQVIAERLHGWAKLFAFFVALPIGVLVLVLAVSGIEKYSDFRKLVEGQLQPRLERAKADADAAEGTARQAKNDSENARRAIQQISAEASRQMASVNELAANVRSLSIKVSQLEQQTSQGIKASSQRVDARVAELDQRVDAATKDIAEQQAKLASTSELVKALYSKRTTEYFTTSAPTPNVAIAPLSKGGLVFLLLKSAPIAETVDVKWRVFSQPRASYTVSGNLLTFVWGDPVDELKQNPIEVTYVPDATSKAVTFKVLTVRDNVVFADETRIANLPGSQAQTVSPPK